MSCDPPVVVDHRPVRLVGGPTAPALHKALDLLMKWRRDLDLSSEGFLLLVKETDEFLEHMGR